MERLSEENKPDHQKSYDIKNKLSIVPLTKNKIPFEEWKEYQKTVSPPSLWTKHYMDGGMVGIICGKVSGNLECIDIDIKHDPQKTIYDEYTALIPESLLNQLIIQKTPTGGYHFIYRCEDAVIDGNHRLALNPDNAPIIETRGEGGYVATGKNNYQVMQGQLDLQSLDIDIPNITSAQRDFLLETARTLTRYFPKKNLKTTYQEPAIEEFNSKFILIDLFEEFGWSVVKQDQQKYYLLRSGSTASHSGYYYMEDRIFFCFSTATEFQPERAYNNFQVLKVLKGKNDYKTTLRLLTEDYGLELSEKRTDLITHDDIANYLNERGVRYDSFIQDLTCKGNIIGEMDLNTLFIDMKKTLGEKVARSKFEETIKSHYIQTINPILDFVEKHKDRNPTNTFKKWLSCIEFKNKIINKDLFEYFIKKWYVGMVAQALDGEYPNEFFLTLLSIEQGVGKTTFLRKYTLPRELHDYRKEHSLSFDDDFKVLMGQTLLIIDDEMDGRTYEMDKTFKTILSTKEMATRRKYDRRISTIKRRCSFAGSGNNLNVVREIKNRRIIPIEVEGFNYHMLDEIDYVDLFMEAFNLYRHNFQYSFVKGDMSLLQHLYEDYILKSDLDLLIDRHIIPPDSEEDSKIVDNLTIVNILTHWYPNLGKRINAITIGKIMNDRGYESVRTGRQKTLGYKVSKCSNLVRIDEGVWKYLDGEL